MDKKLQECIGESPVVEVEDFKNWSTSTRIPNLLVVRPKSLEEVQRVVKAAATLKLRIRCAGATHSWGPMFPDEGDILMYSEDIKRHDGPQIELIKNDGEPTKVNVMCSTTVRELMEFELNNNINLPANVMLRDTMYAGMLATGCHGVGWDFYSLSDYCSQMRIVDHTGTLRTYSKKEDKDMMLAVQCNLGMFGIIYDMQLEVMEKKIVHVKDDFSYTAGDLFYDPVNLKKIVTENDSVELFYFPYSSVGWLDAAEQLISLVGINEKLTRDEWDPKKDRTWLKMVNIPDQSTIQEDKVVNDFYYKFLNMTSWLEGKGIQLVDDFLVTLPQALTPLIAKASSNYLKESASGERYQPLVNAIHWKPKVYLYSVTDMEWAFDVKEDFSVITKACQAVIDILRNEAEKGNFPLNLAMEMRWMKYSDAYLCPAIVGNPVIGGSGHTVYLEILSYTNTPGWHNFANQVANQWKKIPGARPHWAKEWDYLDNIDSYLTKTWSSEIKKFVACVEKSKCDPSGMFLNDRLQKLFFPKKYRPKPKKEKPKTSVCTLL